MRNMRVFALALFSAGCASAGGVFPEAGDGASALANAERQIAAAQQAGADSLAAEVLNWARQHVAVGKTMQGRDDDRAAMHGRQAVADATYARALAARTAAERQQAAAAASLNALPRGGTE
jgi:hypothetical protein